MNFELMKVTEMHICSSTSILCYLTCFMELLTKKASARVEVGRRYHVIKRKEGYGMFVLNMKL